MCDDNNEFEQYFTIKDVAKIFSTSAQMIYKLIHADKLGYIRVGCSIRIPKSAIKQYLNNFKKGANHEISK